MIIRRIEPQQPVRKKRAAAYCRVSTNLQEESYETQYSVYKKMIESNPEYEFAGIYSDKGKSGTSYKHRPGFQQMIADADEKKFDVLYVKSISRFANLLSVSRGSAFTPRITRHSIADHTEIILIEPPCGSNTAIIRSLGETLFIDCGYALYREEMITLFQELLPEWETMKKSILITHADVDHCGLLSLFDEVFASEKSRECLLLEYEGKNGFREQNPLHRPYINICKTLTGYRPVAPEKVTALWGTDEDQKEPLQQIGFFRFGELHFEVYQGQGGHLPGEIILIDYTHHIAFTGDVFINTHGMTREQKAYNQYAPVLMTSVDTNPELCALERRTFMQRLGEGSWQIFGAHGMKKDYQVQAGS